MDYMIAVHTDVGIKKNTNQDAYLVKVAQTGLGKVCFAVVCDGMGGLSKGEEASATVILSFERWFLQESFDYLLTLIASIERSGSSVQIEQILCLDGNEAWGEYGLERNLRAIQEILPLILAGKNYEARYYYKRIAGQPCMGVLQVESFVTRYYAPEDKTLLFAMLDLLKAEREMFRTIRSLTGYFTEEGIRRLMEEGRIDEIPSELYRPIEPRDRRKLLKLLIQAASGNVYSLYLLDADRVSFPAGLQAVGYSMTDVYLVYAAERQDARLSIEERSVARILYTFLENLKISAFVKTKEESLQYLKDVYEEYEE